MAKQPDVIERFTLTCDDVEPGLVGPAVAALTKLGLIKVRFDLVTDVLKFRQKTNHEISSNDFLTEWIKEHPTFKANEAVKAFAADGRTKGSTYPALSVLVEAGVLKKLEPGHYSRADIKHIAPPKKDAKKDAKSKPKGDAQTRYALPHTGLIMRLIKRKNGHITTAQVKAGFEKDGRPPSSASPAIRECLDKKLIKRVGEGEYALPSAKKSAEKPAAPEKTNGNGTTVTEGATNG